MMTATSTTPPQLEEVLDWQDTRAALSKWFGDRELMLQLMNSVSSIRDEEELRASLSVLEADWNDMLDELHGAYASVAAAFHAHARLRRRWKGTRLCEVVATCKTDFATAEACCIRLFREFKSIPPAEPEWFCQLLRRSFAQLVESVPGSPERLCLELCCLGRQLRVGASGPPRETSETNDG